MRKILCVILLCASMLADKRVEIYIEKIHCPLCTAIVRKALLGVSGVKSAKVTQSAKTAVVVADDNVTDKALLDALIPTEYTGVIKR